jgi:uracil-DNA glycosylase family 4
VSPRRDYYLSQLGIPVWRTRTPAPDDEAASTSAATPLTIESSMLEPAQAQAQAETATAQSDVWGALESAVRGCTKCALHKSRTQTVFGVGKRDAELFVIGEAPGADEDRQGEPFVGRAGQLLNAMLRAMGLPRGEVYIANILKCRPPNNRDPETVEASACTPYLSRQIELVRPKVLLAVGRISAQWLLQTDSPIGRLRGRVFNYGDAGTPLVVTYHPAYLLRSPLAKATAWQDLCMVKDLLSKSQ